jgi:hypothetical protein
LRQLDRRIGCPAFKAALNSSRARGKIIRNANPPPVAVPKREQCVRMTELLLDQLKSVVQPPDAASVVARARVWSRWFMASSAE